MDLLGLQNVQGRVRAHAVRGGGRFVPYLDTKDRVQEKLGLESVGHHRRQASDFR
jgi:hypothetical protein